MKTTTHVQNDVAVDKITFAVPAPLGALYHAFLDSLLPLNIYVVSIGKKSYPQLTRSKAAMDQQHWTAAHQSPSSPVALLFLIQRLVPSTMVCGEQTASANTPRTTVKPPPLPACAVEIELRDGEAVVSSLLQQQRRETTGVQGNTLR